MNTFYKGFIFALCLMSLIQDFVYKNAENYAQHILNGGWMDRSISIPLAIVVLIIIIIKKEK